MGTSETHPTLGIGDPDTESKRLLMARQKERKQVMSCFQELMFSLLDASKLLKLESPAQRSKKKYL
jgi:hypothetical protein